MGADDDPLASDKMQAVLEFLRKNGESDLSDIVASTGFPRGTVHVYVRRALHRGWIQNPSRGRYAPDLDGKARFTFSTPRALY